MRLTLCLAKWPKTMPKGNIWTGTNRMVPRMLGPNKKRVMLNVQREKENLFYLMRPAVSFEAEDAFHKWRAETEPSEQDVKDKLDKASLEHNEMRPIPMRNHYQVTNLYNTFEKD